MMECKFCEGLGEIPNQYRAVLGEINSINKALDLSCPVCNGEKQVEYTCEKCKDVETCDMAFDDYNTNGDCLAANNI